MRMTTILIISVSFSSAWWETWPSSWSSPASLCKIRQNQRKLGRPSQNQELKTRQALTKLETPMPIFKLKTENRPWSEAPTKLGQIPNPKHPCKMRTNPRSSETSTCSKTARPFSKPWNWETQKPMDELLMLWPGQVRSGHGFLFLWLGFPLIWSHLRRHTLENLVLFL